ncbi:hypothetical protein BD309DRAFT_632640 [Dichomitus squalens]|nr:hypothetical protein BD309DRAFT_632640 [Dichomitus squalens]
MILTVARYVLRSVWYGAPFVPDTGRSLWKPNSTSHASVPGSRAGRSQQFVTRRSPHKEPSSPPGSKHRRAPLPSQVCAPANSDCLLGVPRLEVLPIEALSPREPWEEQVSR